MTILYPPLANSARSRHIRFESTGREAQSDPETGAIHAISEEEASELEADGWHRQASKVMNADDLRKVVNADARRSGFVLPQARKASDAALRRDAADAELRHVMKADGPRRVVVGEVNADPFGRVHVEYDQGAREIMIHGVTVLAEDIHPPIRDAFINTVGSFLDAAQDAAMQTIAQTTIGAIVAAALQHHSWLADKVKQQQRRVA